MLITGADLLMEIADAIEARPAAYNQGAWLADGNGDLDPHKGFKLLMEGACGTTACVAGWAVALNSKDRDLKAKIKDLADNDELAEMAGHLLWPLLDKDDTEELFSGGWVPRNSKSVPSALRKIARGKPVFEV